MCIELNIQHVLLRFENLGCCFLAREEKLTISDSKQSQDQAPISTSSPHARMYKFSEAISDTYMELRG